MNQMVAAGLEPASTASSEQRSTRLSYTTTDKSIEIACKQQCELASGMPKHSGASGKTSMDHEPNGHNHPNERLPSGFLA